MQDNREYCALCGDAGWTLLGILDKGFKVVKLPRGQRQRADEAQARRSFQGEGSYEAHTRTHPYLLMDYDYK